MSAALFITGLRWNVDEALLTEAISAFGPGASATVMRDPETGRSFGVGFVTFGERSSADRVAEEVLELAGHAVRWTAALERRTNADGRECVGISVRHLGFLWRYFDDGFEDLVDLSVSAELRRNLVDDGSYRELRELLRGHVLYNEPASLG